VLDAVREMKINPAKNLFQFEDQGEIALKITCGFWITMNPGYAGRTELPENLKALFRSRHGRPRHCAHLREHAYV